MDGPAASAPLSSQVEDALIALVRDVAGREILPRFRRLSPDQVDTKSGPFDLVTEADRRAEAALRQGLQSILPGAAFIGEESASDPEHQASASAGPLCAVVDPVDGTWNFANGLAVFGTILAVLRDGQTVFGLLYDPVMDDWIVARRGGGTWYGRPGRAPVQVFSGTPGDGQRPAGYVPLSMLPHEDALAVAQALPQLGPVTSLRCSCHEYRQLAQGHVDFVVSAGLNVWDHAAGELAVIEAGGAASMADGSAYQPTMTQGRLLTARSSECLEEVGRIVPALRLGERGV